jgi:hypothetical protein
MYLRHSSRHRLRFQDFAYAVDFRELTGIKLGHEVTAMWRIDDLAFGFESLQGLPHRNDADPKLRGQQLLAQLLAGTQATASYPQAQFAEGGFLRRYGDTLAARRRYHAGQPSARPLQVSDGDLLVMYLKDRKVRRQ